MDFLVDQLELGLHSISRLRNLSFGLPLAGIIKDMQMSSLASWTVVKVAMKTLFRFAFDSNRSSKPAA